MGGLLFATLPSALGPQVQAFAYDAQANVTGMVEMAHGSVSARYDYDALGNPALIEGSAAEANPFRFSTKWMDAASGYLDYGRRIYAPGIGRWLSRDPEEEIGGANPYGFVFNAAPQLFDPNGGSIKDILSASFTAARAIVGVPVSILSGDFIDADKFRHVEAGKCRALVIINGIWNEDSDITTLAAGVAASARYKGASPLTVVNRTHYVLGDLFQIIGHELGAIDISAQRAAKQIAIAAEDLKKSKCCCGSIEVFAHSQGTMVFNRALPLIADHVRRLICYTGIGGEKFINLNAGLAIPAENYANYNDVLNRDWIPVVGNSTNPLRLMDVSQYSGVNRTYTKSQTAALVEHGFVKHYAATISTLAPNCPCNFIK